MIGIELTSENIGNVIQLGSSRVLIAKVGTDPIRAIAAVPVDATKPKGKQVLLEVTATTLAPEEETKGLEQQLVVKTWQSLDPGPGTTMDNYQRYAEEHNLYTK